MELQVFFFLGGGASQNEFPWDLRTRFFGGLKFWDSKVGEGGIAERQNVTFRKRDIAMWPWPISPYPRHVEAEEI